MEIIDLEGINKVVAIWNDLYFDATFKCNISIEQLTCKSQGDICSSQYVKIHKGYVMSPITSSHCQLSKVVSKKLNPILGCKVSEKETNINNQNIHHLPATLDYFYHQETPLIGYDEQNAHTLCFAKSFACLLHYLEFHELAQNLQTNSGHVKSIVNSAYNSKDGKLLRKRFYRPIKFETWQLKDLVENSNNEDILVFLPSGKGKRDEIWCFATLKFLFDCRYSKAFPLSKNAIEFCIGSVLDDNNTIKVVYQLKRKI